jgi:hypothetical protein
MARGEVGFLSEVEISSFLPSFPEAGSDANIQGVGKAAAAAAAAVNNNLGGAAGARAVPPNDSFSFAFATLWDGSEQKKKVLLHSHGNGLWE